MKRNPFVVMYLTKKDAEEFATECKLHGQSFSIRSCQDDNRTMSVRTPNTDLTLKYLFREVPKKDGRKTMFGTAVSALKTSKNYLKGKFNIYDRTNVIKGEVVDPAEGYYDPTVRKA